MKRLISYKKSLKAFLSTYNVSTHNIIHVKRFKYQTMYYSKSERACTMLNRALYDVLVEHEYLDYSNYHIYVVEIQKDVFCEVSKKRAIEIFSEYK